MGVDGLSTEAGKTRGVRIIAAVNFLAYVVLLIAFLGIESFFFFGLFPLHLGVLYSIVGIVCSYGLHQYRKWSWYLAITMWIGEGIYASWGAYVSTHFPYTQGTLLFLLIASFRLASVAYFVTGRVRKDFEVGQHIVDDDL